MVTLMAGAVAFAASDTKNLTINATVSSTAKLTLTGGPVNFPDADPDVTSTITSANVVTIDAKAKTGSASAITLTCKANTDLTSGGNTIGIDQISWDGADTIGTGFAASGTMSNAADIAVGGWTGSGARQGTQTYKLVNSWTYATGSYSAVVVYTLTVP
jgi:hypothetical protein